LAIIKQPENSLRGGHPADYPRHGVGLGGIAADANAAEQVKDPDRHLRGIHALRPLVDEGAAADVALYPSAGILRREELPVHLLAGAVEEARPDPVFCRSRMTLKW